MSNYDTDVFMPIFDDIQKVICEIFCWPFYDILLIYWDTIVWLLFKDAFTALL